MNATEILIPAQKVQSLAWDGDALIDWAGGHKRYCLDGEIKQAIYAGYGSMFDAAVASPSGEYAVIYTKVGTKGLVLRRGKIIREINRSYYCADAYEYPVALFRLRDGREVIAHCPDEYCRLDIEDLETGECLTRGENRKPADFFQSRLNASPDGTYLLSAGWCWHPWDGVKVFDVATALHDPGHLDHGGMEFGSWEEEANAIFLKDNRLVVALNSDESPPVGKGLRIYDLGKSTGPVTVPYYGVNGTMMPVGTGHLLNLHKHPKLIDLRTGEVVQEWPHIHSGIQTSSIIWSSKIPVIAPDPIGKRCAIAGENAITVLIFEE